MLVSLLDEGMGQGQVMGRMVQGFEGTRIWEHSCLGPGRECGWSHIE